MPIKKSAKKELRKSNKRAIHNKKIKNDLKDLIKKSQKAIESKDPKVNELVQSSIKALDKAARKGIIKKNAGNRKKSRLQRKLNQVQKTK